MGLIFKRYSLTLNQRVQGSSPCAPTNQINNLTYSAAGRILSRTSLALVGAGLPQARPMRSYSLNVADGLLADICLQQNISALPPKADIGSAQADVC